MSSTFSANAGSFERLKVRTRWGSTRWARQIRWIVRSARPTRSATARPVQCVTSPGGSEQVNGQDLGDGLGRHGRLAGWTRLVPQQSFDAFFGEALLPAPYRGAAHADALCDLQHRQALVGAEDDARPLDVLVRAVPVSDESGEALTITGVEEDARGLGHAPRLAHLRRNVTVAVVEPVNAIDLD